MCIRESRRGFSVGCLLATAQGVSRAGRDPESHDERESAEENHGCSTDSTLNQSINQSINQSWKVDARNVSIMRKSCFELKTKPKKPMRSVNTVALDSVEHYTVPFRPAKSSSNLIAYLSFLVKVCFVRFAFYERFKQTANLSSSVLVVESYK